MPKRGGSQFFNYKKFHSIVLMAVCDANYTFTAASIGAYGSQSDGGIFRLSPYGKSLLDGSLPLPGDKPLPRITTNFPHFFVGDAAFPLRENLMRPYAASSEEQRRRERTTFNYRLSRARRVIENAFGIMAARWRILLTTIEMAPENVERIVLTCVALHNFIMLNDQSRWYCPPEFVDDESGVNLNGLWRNEIASNAETPLRSYASHSRRSSTRALLLRDTLAAYFCAEGSIETRNQ